MPRSASLKASAVCVFSAATKPYMNFSAVRYSTLRSPAALPAQVTACSGDGVLPRLDTGVDIERVEHHGIAAPALGDLTRRRMRQRVGTADDKARKGQARIERRAAERVMIGGDWRGRGRAQLERGAAVARLGPARVERGRGASFGVGAGAAHCRRAHGEIDPVHFRHLGLPAREHALGIMRLDPALQKTRRHRQMHALVLHGFEVHARKPAGVDVFPHARPQTTLDARPAILFRICHCLESFSQKRVIALCLTIPPRRVFGVPRGATSSGRLQLRDMALLPFGADAAIRSTV